MNGFKNFEQIQGATISLIWVIMIFGIVLIAVFSILVVAKMRKTMKSTKKIFDETLSKDAKEETINKHCPYCDSLLDAKDKHCPYCNAKIK